MNTNALRRATRSRSGFRHWALPGGAWIEARPLWGGIVCIVMRSAGGSFAGYWRVWSASGFIALRREAVRWADLRVPAESPARVKARRDRARREALLCES